MLNKFKMKNKEKKKEKIDLRKMFMQPEYGTVLMLIFSVVLGSLL